jgi:ABC-type dipeptide/oligopeptide/nickel transport system permease component
LLVFSVHLGWVHAVGGGGGGTFLLAVLTLAIAPVAIIAQMTRASMLEVAQSDHVRTARAKGLSRRVVVLRHVFRNSLIPVVTIGGLLASELLTGAVFVEVVYSRSGIGSFAVTAVHNRDLPQVQGVVLLAAVIFVLVNLAVDVLYGVIDARVRTPRGAGR